MTRHVMMKAPLLASSDDSTMRKYRRRKMIRHTERMNMGEVAGGAAAECAAVCCCCPCAVVNLVVLAVFRVPAAVCRKAWRQSLRRRIMRKQHGLLTSATMEGNQSIFREEEPTAEIIFIENEKTGELNDIVRLENEMLEHFYGTGFWRSPSQKDMSL